MIEYFIFILTLRVARLLTVCRVIGDVFMVTPAIRNTHIRFYRGRITNL